MPKIAVLTLILFYSIPSHSANTPEPTRRSLGTLRAPHVQIFDGEPILTRPNNARGTLRSTGKKRLLLNALERTFDLELETNAGLLSKLPENIRNKTKTALTFYRGRLPDAPGSWVRLTQSGDRIIGGAIYDGFELFLIDAREILDHAFIPAMAELRALPPETAIMFRATDVVTTEACGVTNAHQSMATLDSLVGELEQSLARAVGAPQQLDATLVADTAYAATSNGDVIGQLMTQMNVVDGVLSEQAGLQINLLDVAELVNDGPLTATKASRLLDQFRAFSFNQLTNNGVSHLLTGRDLDGGIVGMAFLGSVCDPSSAVAVSQAGGRGVIGALTVAHEIAHNLGSPHDNESGSVCVNAPGTYLMNPVITGSQTFSQCSLDQMSPVIGAARCLAAVAPDPVTVINANFNQGRNGFVYSDDVFRDTANPMYAKGQYLNTGKRTSIGVKLGGRDSAIIRGLSGGWRRQFSLARPRRLSLSVQIRLVQGAGYEAGEFSEVIVALDGQPITVAKLVGDGNGGSKRIIGWQVVEADLGFVSAGPHFLTLGGYNNKKTAKDEWTVVRFDDVVLNAR